MPRRGSASDTRGMIADRPPRNGFVCESAGVAGTRVQRKASPLAVILVFVLSAYAFWPSLHNGFVSWDDPLNFTDNPHYRGLGWSQLKWMFTSLHTGPYIPLTWISLAVDYLMWGLNPSGYHLT